MKTNRRNMLKAAFGGLLGWLGLSKVEEIRAEDLGVNSCFISNGDKTFCFSIIDVEVSSRLLYVEINPDQIPQYSAICDLSCVKLPLHGNIQFQKGNLKQTLNFKDYVMSWCAATYVNDKKKVVFALWPREIMGD